MPSALYILKIMNYLNDQCLAFHQAKVVASQVYKQNVGLNNLTALKQQQQKARTQNYSLSPGKGGVSPSRQETVSSEQKHPKLLWA